MQEIIITNGDDKNLRKTLAELSEKADKIKIATAFFSDTAFITTWLENSKQVDLLVSLRPPTNYYALKKVHPKIGINVQFLGDNFHSKFYIFYQKGYPFACIIGSSNFTAGGLSRNIETNAIFTDAKYVKELDRQFSSLWEQSFSLLPTDLDDFKVVFDNFRNRAQQTEKEQAELETKILTNRAKKKEKSKIRKEASQYLSFWRVVDEVEEMVNEISAIEYPNVPVYIAIDHFWHWVKVVWANQNRPKPSVLERDVIIPKLFKEYCDWDKGSEKHTSEMAIKSKDLFGKLLAENHIDKLMPDEARLIYANLHSGNFRTRRFGADEKFVTENTIQKIRASLKYLLYSNDEIDLRIHNLCFNPDFKLSQLKSSGTQELIGWVSPEKYPMRNDKADAALELLGFQIE